MNKIEINLNDDLVIIEKKQMYLASLGEFTTDDFVITTKEEAGQVADTKDAIKLAIKDIEKRRMLITKPLEESKASAIAQERELTAPMKESLSKLRQKGQVWIDKVRKEQEETERIIRQKKIDRLEAEKEEIAEQADINDSELALTDAIEIEEKIEVLKDIPIQKIKTNIRSSSGFGKMHIRKTWKVKVKDFSKLPDMYKIPNDTMLNSVVRGKNGLREIDGCKIWEDESVI